MREIENYRENPVCFKNVPIENNTVLSGVYGVKIEIICDIFVGDSKRSVLKFLKAKTITLVFIMTPKAERLCSIVLKQASLCFMM